MSDGPILYLMCGLAFSGKTTLARALCRQLDIPDEPCLRYTPDRPGAAWLRASMGGTRC